MHVPEDAGLVRLIARGGRERERAFAELYARHGQRIYLYCRKILGDADQAADLFQETFLAFLQHVDRGGEVRNVPAFLLRIARNRCLNARRDAGPPALELEERHLATEDRPLESIELERRIEAALTLLIPEHREAFVLQVYNGLSYAEIADVTGVPLTTVRNRVVRARKKLRELLSAYAAATRP